MAIVYSAHKLVLRLYEMTDHDGQVSYSVNVTGVKTGRRSDKAVILSVGRNEVDDDFFRAWYEQNKDGSLVRSGAVIWEREKEQNEQRESGETGL